MFAPAVGSIFAPRRRIAFRRVGSLENRGTNTIGLEPLSHPLRADAVLGMIHSPPLAHARVDAFAHAFKPQRRSGSGGGSEFYAEAMDRRLGGMAPHTFRGRHRSPPPARPFTGDFEPSFKCAANDVAWMEHIQGEDGWEREGVRECDGLRAPGEGFYCECSPIVIDCTLQDFFSLAIQLQQSTTLRRYSPPFNPLRLIK
ncbi:uncharacterized protein ARMOST_12313 [Armillaria ostoyae]|uniref:Uncharacterized protein n=1 Tax=Armillaria ostoyae TaxID=47428 RepID=A0A284RJJ2_ARMOS|nr:uncharacterized protein ARMOST_12313 [Armillaria ostoyae]